MSPRPPVFTIHIVAAQLRWVQMWISTIFRFNVYKTSTDFYNTLIYNI